MADEGAEKRRSRRFEVEGLEGSFIFSLDLRVLNLSVTGMAVETSGRLNVGRGYVFKISADGAELSIPGRVAWCVLGRTRRNDRGDVQPVYKAGIQFTEMLSEKAEALIELIERKAALRLEKRVFGRFHMQEGQEISLDSEAGFAVRKLSLTGMLVEAEAPLQLGSEIAPELKLGDEIVVLPSRVAFVERIARTETYQLGLEFGEISPGQRATLERYIGEVVSEKRAG